MWIQLITLLYVVLGVCMTSELSLLTGIDKKEEKMRKKNTTAPTEPKIGFEQQVTYVVCFEQPEHKVQIYRIEIPPITLK